MSARVAVYKGAIPEGRVEVDIPGLNPATPFHLVVKTQEGFGMLLTLSDAFGTVAWQESLEGLELSEFNSNLSDRSEA
jgi:hypothetical protein